MVVQVVPQSDPFASVGQAAGEGLSEGLQMLINQKVEGIKRDRIKKNLMTMGLSPGIADLDPRIAAQVVRQEMAQKGMKDLLGLLEEQPPAVTEEQPPAITEGEGVPPTEGVEPVPKEVPKGLGRLSDEKLVIYAGQGGNVGEIAKAELLRRSQIQKGEERKEERKGERHARISEKVLIKADEQAAEIPQKTAALESMELAVKERNMGFFSRDNLAEITGVEGLRSPEGALFLTASKEYFLGSLKRAGARPNQWIERQIQKMLPKVGRTTEANLSVVEALRADLAVENKRLELTEQLANESEEKYGYVHRNLGSQVLKKLTPFANRQQKELEQRLREIKKDAAKSSKVKKASPGMVNIIRPDGRRGQIPKENLEKALELGATLQ